MKCPECGEKLESGQNEYIGYFYCWNCGYIITVFTKVYSSN